MKNSQSYLFLLLCDPPYILQDTSNTSLTYFIITSSIIIQLTSIFICSSKRHREMEQQQVEWHRSSFIMCFIAVRQWEGHRKKLEILSRSTMWWQEPKSLSSYLLPFRVYSRKRNIRLEPGTKIRLPDMRCRCLNNCFNY